MTVETPTMPALAVSSGPSSASTLATAPTSSAATSSTSTSTSTSTAPAIGVDTPAARLSARTRPRVRSRSPRTSLEVSRLASLGSLSEGSDVECIEQLASGIARVHEWAEGNGFFGPVEGVLGNGPGQTVILVARSSRRGCSRRQESEGEKGDNTEGYREQGGGGEVVGAAQILFNAKPNAHRADLRLVVTRDPDGEVARRLMAAAEEEAKAGKAKLMLLTTIAHSPAQALYESLGWTLSGVIPAYAAYERQMRDAALLYKDLRCGNCDECECEPETKLQW